MTRAPAKLHTIMDRALWLIHRIGAAYEGADGIRFGHLWQREARVRRIAHEAMDREFARTTGRAS